MTKEENLSLVVEVGDITSFLLFAFEHKIIRYIKYYTILCLMAFMWLITGLSLIDIIVPTPVSYISK